MNQKKKLNLNKKNVPPNTEIPELTQAEAIRQVNEFYNTLTNCMISAAGSLDKISHIVEGIMVELSDIKDNLNRKGIKEEWITQFEIEEREKEDEPEEPAGEK